MGGASVSRQHARCTHAPAHHPHEHKLSPGRPGTRWARTGCRPGPADRDPWRPLRDGGGGGEQAHEAAARRAGGWQAGAGQDRSAPPCRLAPRSLPLSPPPRRSTALTQLKARHLVVLHVPHPVQHGVGGRVGRDCGEQGGHGRHTVSELASRRAACNVPALHSPQAQPALNPPVKKCHCRGGTGGVAASPPSSSTAAPAAHAAGPASAASCAWLLLRLARSMERFRARMRAMLRRLKAAANRSSSSSSASCSCSACRCASCCCCAAPGTSSAGGRGGEARRLTGGGGEGLAI